MATLESLDAIVEQIKEKMREGNMIQEEHEPLSTFESACVDCQRDKDLCPDCDNGDKYISPDLIEGNR